MYNQIYVCLHCGADDRQTLTLNFCKQQVSGGKVALWLKLLTIYYFLGFTCEYGSIIVDTMLKF